MPTRSKYTVLNDNDFGQLMDRNLRLLEEQLFQAEWNLEMNDRLSPPEAIAKLQERVRDQEQALDNMRIKKAEWDAGKPK